MFFGLVIGKTVATLALFIGNLAFSGAPELLDHAKIGVLTGSLVAGVLGAALLRATSGTAARS